MRNRFAVLYNIDLSLMTRRPVKFDSTFPRRRPDGRLAFHVHQASSLLARGSSEQFDSRFRSFLSSEAFNLIKVAKGGSPSNFGVSPDVLWPSVLCRERLCKFAARSCRVACPFPRHNLSSLIIRAHRCKWIRIDGSVGERRDKCLLRIAADAVFIFLRSVPGFPSLYSGRSVKCVLRVLETWLMLVSFNTLTVYIYGAHSRRWRFIILDEKWRLRSRC